MMQNDCPLINGNGSPNSSDRWPLASTGQRFANFLIDTVAFYALSFVIALLLALFGRENLVENMSTASSILWSLALRLLYYFALEATAGRTIGKLFTRTRVVMEDGSEPSVGVIFLRTISRLVPFDVFSFLSSESGWHDTISKTKVVRVDR